MENLGLGIKLQFDQGNSVAQMGAVNSTLTNLRNGFNALSGGLDNLVSGFARLTAIGGGITVLFGLGANQAMNYERKLSSLRALIRQSSTDVEGDMQRLTRGTIDVGGTMFFVNSEIVEVEESMARFGLTSTEILEALPAALRMASAEGMDAADAANGLLTVMRQFDLPFTEAQNVTDQLAKTSAITATTMEELSYGLQYVSSSGNLMGESVTDVITLLGLLADAGHRGSSGGMALNQAYEQISKMTPKAQRALARIGLTARDFKDSEGNFIGMIDTFRLLGSHITNISGNFDRATILQDIFSVRGRRAVAPLLRMVQDVGSRFETVREQIIDSAGTADQMARDRMKNFYTMIKRIPMILMEIINTRFFLDLLEPLRLAFMPIVDLLYDIAQAMNETKSPTNEVSKTAWSIAAGLKDARNVLMGMIQKVDELKDKFIQAFSIFSRGKGSSTDESNPLRKFVKYLVLAAPIIIGLTALMGGLGIIGLFLSGTAAVGGALTTVIPYLVILLGSVIAFFLLSKKEGESWGDTLERQWDRISQIGKAIWSVFQGIGYSINETYKVATFLFGDIWNNLKRAGISIGIIFDQLGIDSRLEWFQYLGIAIGVIFANLIISIAFVAWFIKDATYLMGVFANVCQDAWDNSSVFTYNLFNQIHFLVVEIENILIRIANKVSEAFNVMKDSIVTTIINIIDQLYNIPIVGGVLTQVFGEIESVRQSFSHLLSGVAPVISPIHNQMPQRAQYSGLAFVSSFQDEYRKRNTPHYNTPVNLGFDNSITGLNQQIVALKDQKLKEEAYSQRESIFGTGDLSTLASIVNPKIQIQINNNLDGKKLNDTVKGQQANNNNRHGRRNNGSDGSNETPWQRTMIIENNFV